MTIASNEYAQVVNNALDGTGLEKRTLKVNYLQPKKETLKFKKRERPKTTKRRIFGDEHNHNDIVFFVFVRNSSLD